jgi:hypothetical protein
MDIPRIALMRLLCATGPDGQPHHYGLTPDEMLIVDGLLVVRIEPPSKRGAPFQLVTESDGVVDITSDHLWSVVSGRIWTRPRFAYQKAVVYARRYDPQPKPE